MAGVCIKTSYCSHSADLSTYIYVFAFKLNGSAEEAIKQINNRGYLIPFVAHERTLIKIGASFSAEERNIDRWIIE